MSELVLLHHNEPMTTSLAIADGTENTHKSVIQLIRKYVDDLQNFGPCGFEIHVAGNSASGMRNSAGRPTEVAYLNEQQATLLITYLRNSEIVRRFKIALVKAFFELRDSLRAQTPQFTTRQLDHGADLAVAADRTFRSFLRAARSAGMPLSAALRVANRQTQARTGMDMLSELDVDPDSVTVKAADQPKALQPDPITDALLEWAEQAASGTCFRMGEILARACEIQQGTKPFERVSPVAGRLLRRLGWRQTFCRMGGAAHRYWVKP